jgi:hypothetical protein
MHRRALFASGRFILSHAAMSDLSRSGTLTASKLRHGLRP